MYEELCSYDNLLVAYSKARQGKARKYYVLEFEKNLQENLLQLRDELLSQTYKPKPLKSFIIRDPKTRKISKSRFRDRVIHHALVNIIGHLFQKSFIYDSHANQVGKGALRAVERFDYFKRKVSRNGYGTCYVLKADIRHYFEEVNHNILLEILERKINDKRVMWLIRQILSNLPEGRSGGGGERPKGMPLGNHTSQFFANVYLNELDQYVKHLLKARHYIRYVDDFVILSNSKEQLEKNKQLINAFLQEHLSLSLHPDKSKIYDLRQGVPFLGFRMFTSHRLVRKSNLRKFEKKLKREQGLYREEQISREHVVEHIEGWMAYAKHANTYAYRRDLLKRFNKLFPIKHTNQIVHSKKMKNFYRKVYASKLEFSVQKTLLLVRKGLGIMEIAKEREIKEGTVWRHFSNLIEYGQLAVWKIFPRKKILAILPHIKDGEESLSKIKERIIFQVSFDEIECVRAYVRFKEKIAQKNKLKNKHN